MGQLGDLASLAALPIAIYGDHQQAKLGRRQLRNQERQAAHDNRLAREQLRMQQVMARWQRASGRQEAALQISQTLPGWQRMTALRNAGIR